MPEEDKDRWDHQVLPFV